MKLNSKNLFYIATFLVLVLARPSLATPIISEPSFSIFSQDIREDNNEQKTNVSTPENLTINKILFEGNRLVTSDEILNVISTQVGKPFNKEDILNDLEAIDKLGYFIRDSIQAKPQKTEEGILLKIRIEENSPITNVQILGNTLIPQEEILFIVQDLIGKPESLSKITQAIDLVEKKYQERGYVLASVSNIALDPDGTITIWINEGILNNIVIKGNTKTKEKYIRRLTPNLKSGDAYNELLLVQDFRNLENTGFFDEIHRSLIPSSEDPSRYDLQIELKERRTASFGFGGGVNTVHGAFANLGFNNNNLFGEGKSVSLNTQFGTGLLANSFLNQRFLSERRTINAEARYTDPNFLNTNNQVSFFTHGYTFNSYLVDLAQEKNLALGVSVTRPLGKNFYGGFDLIGEDVKMKEYNNSALNFLTDQIVNVENGKYLENVTQKSAFKPGQSFINHLSDVNKETASKIAREIREEQLKAGRYIHLNPSFIFDTRDNKLSSQSGWYTKINAGPSIGLGQNTFGKLGIDVRRFVPIGQKVTLAFNVQGASSIFGDVPMYSQYKAGGYYGVRGYRSFSDLGIGSRSLFASAEVRTPLLDALPGFKKSALSENLKLVFFSDFGFVGGNDRINRLFNRLATAASYGVGLRANIPMLGPVRIDYGMPFTKALWNHKNILGKFNFGFGERF